MGRAGHKPNRAVVATHYCGVPGCGATWSANVPIRLPCQIDLMRLVAA